MQQIRLSLRAWVELLALAAIWGGSFLAYELILRQMGVMTLVAHRVLWAALVLWVVALRRGHKIPRSRRIWLGFAVMGLLNNAVPFALIAYGQQSIESGLAAILNATTAIWGVGLAALVFPDERLTANRAAGVALGVAGLVVVIGPGSLIQVDPRDLGQVAVVGATLSYALAGIWARKRLAGLPPIISAAGMLTAAAMLMVPMALATEGWQGQGVEGGARLTTLLAMGYLSLGATAGAYLLYYRVLAMAGSGNLMLVTILVSPIAVVLGALVLGEVLPPRAFAGFGLIALGMIVLDGRAWRRMRGAVARA